MTLASFLGETEITLNACQSNATQQTLAGGSPVSGFFGKVRGRVAEALRGQ